jgi:hypothetical protein
LGFCFHIVYDEGFNELLLLPIRKGEGTMKTILFSHFYLGGRDEQGGLRTERTEKWLNYYEPLLIYLGAAEIFFIDDASSMESLSKLGGEIITPNFKQIKQATFRPYLKVIRFPQRRPRKGIFDYPYYWRGMRLIPKLMRHFKVDKLINNDTDLFLLTPNIVNYIRELNKGWVSFWCPKYNWPESALNILNKDSVTLLSQLSRFSDTRFTNKPAEILLPFSYVNKNFNGDRFGEDKVPQSPAMDFYAQTPNEVLLTYNMLKSRYRLSSAA